MGLLRSLVTSIAFQPPPPDPTRRSERGTWSTLRLPSGAEVPLFEAALTERSRRAASARGSQSRREAASPARSSLPADSSQGRDMSDTCVLYSHGNAEDLDEISPYLQHLCDALGLAVFGYDYPGYGGSAEPCSESGCYEAADAAWARVRERFARVVLFGRSLGSGPAVWTAHARCTARDEALVGLVLQSPLTSGIGTAIGRAAWLVRGSDVFRNIDRIGSITVPVTVMHGERDAVVPCSHGRQLLRTVERAGGCARPPLWVAGAGHNDLPEEACTAHAAAFVRGLR